MAAPTDDILPWVGPEPLPTDRIGPYPQERMVTWRLIDEARNSRIPDHEGMVVPVADQA